MGDFKAERAAIHGVLDKGRAASALVAIVSALFAMQAKAGAPTPLFASEASISISISAPWRDVVRLDPADEPLPGVLTIGGEDLDVTIGTRGKSRRRKEVCDFPPLRVTFADKPPQSSLFHKQKSLKLVSYCRKSSSHQQIVLREYAVYKLYNAVTPASFRARLANVAYVDAKSGKTDVERTGFFIEDLDDLADRVDAKKVERGSVPISMYARRDAARAAVFEYMISNIDWDMTAGPPGEDCCHNIRIVGATKTATSDLTPIPFDFDMSGVVDAPYWAAPPQVKVKSSTTRVYRGLCGHNAETRAAAADFRPLRPAFEAAIAEVPGLSASNRKKATNFLAGFFKATADDAAIEKNLIKKCR